MQILSESHFLKKDRNSLRISFQFSRINGKLLAFANLLLQTSEPTGAKKILQRRYNQQSGQSPSEEIIILLYFYLLTY